MIRSLAFIAVCAAVGGCSNEVDIPRSAVPAFAEIDTNDDGFLSQQEANAVPQLVEIFTVADSDQDGALSVAEFSQATIEGSTVSEDAAGGPLFTSLDTDGDGVIDQDEAAEVPELRLSFAQFDRDASGDLDADEYSEAAAEDLSPDDASR
jgi:hypothetical protein